LGADLVGQITGTFILLVVVSAALVLLWALLIKLPGLAENLTRRLMGDEPNVEQVARRMRRATCCAVILGVAYVVFGERSDSFFLREFE
jgi:hypothetical protein